LVDIQSAALAAKFKSSSNRFFNGALPSDEWFVIGQSTKNLGQFKAAVSDNSSVALEAKYKHPELATLASYHSTLGGPATHEAFMAEALQQSKDQWRAEYTAKAVVYWIQGCFEE
jgi:hypothetical protein